MVTRETPKLHTVEEFEAFIARPENIDRHFELIHGEFVEKPMVTQEHGRIIHILSGELYIYFKPNPIGYGEIVCAIECLKTSTTRANQIYL